MDQPGVQAASAVLSLLLLTSSLVQPIMAGVHLVPASPRDVFVVSKLRGSLSIYTATTTSANTTSWDLDQVWTFSPARDSLTNNSTELFLAETNRSEAGLLILSSDLTEADRAVLGQGSVFIASRLNPLDWKRKRGLVR